tara:strand:- start:362 stop:826 length:465 start_codon:yes stop_codon:yes gene_type:complete
MVDIIIIIILIYFGYIGYKNGFIRELTNMISYVFGLILSSMVFHIFSNSLSTLITQNGLKDKIAYLISFIIIVYFFKILTRFVETLIHMKWKNKLLGLTLGLCNGLIILSLTISIYQEIIPKSFNQIIPNKSILYKNIDLLQKNYIIQDTENQK